MEFRYAIIELFYHYGRISFHLIATWNDSSNIMSDISNNFKNIFKLEYEIYLKHNIIFGIDTKDKTLHEILESMTFDEFSNLVNDHHKNFNYETSIGIFEINNPIFNFINFHDLETCIKF